MSAWPDPAMTAVFDPTRSPAAAETDEDLRFRIASARVRDGLPVSDEILDDVIAYARREGTRAAGRFTESERHDVYEDHLRRERAQLVLADAGEVLNRIEMCWLNGRRAVRVLLTEELDRYERALVAELGVGRVVVERVRFTAEELSALHARVRSDAEELAEQGVSLSHTGPGRNGLEIGYFATDFEGAEQLLRDRYGSFSTITYHGATRYRIREHPFGSWLAEGTQLHLFYGLPHNGEAPAGCTAVEREDTVIVSLTIRDWWGAKTLIGGFTPSHMTVELEGPLGRRAVIDNSENRARPHWTVAAKTKLPRPQDR